MPLLTEWSNLPKPIVGMLHLPPLPGSPGFGGSLDAVRDRMLRDADLLAGGGVHGLMIENFGDVPFFPGRVPAHTVAVMTAMAKDVRERFPEIPLGINVLRNDGQSALAVALATGASFIRVNVLCGARLADQGIIQGIAHELLRDRAMLRAERIKILADVNVKHSSPLAPISIENEVEDTLHRGLADGLIVSGSGTGKPTDPGELERVKRAAGGTPVFIGSGSDERTIPMLMAHADGFIIGSAFKREGRASNPVDPERVGRIVGMVG
ncbi:MAG TPA: BtpA/SgcQ family protein [Tepidisphaeraceae bacterium]